MKRVVYMTLALVFSAVISSALDYKSEVSNWKSDKDVAKWMRNNWHFDKNLAKSVVRKIRSEGPGAVTVKSAEEIFETSKGWCKDAANFAKDTLNTINPEYKAGYIFINNKVKGAPNHWVTGFKKEGKLYVMDYGAGSHWKSMMGLHGPYDSIKEYEEYLSNINAKNFELDFAIWASSDKKSNAKSKNCFKKI